MNLCHLRFGIRGQQSGSVVVNLEVFTNRARHAVRYQEILYSLYQDMLYTFGGRGPPSLGR